MAMEQGSWHSLEGIMKSHGAQIRWITGSEILTESFFPGLFDEVIPHSSCFLESILKSWVSRILWMSLFALNLSSHHQTFRGRGVAWWVGQMVHVHEVWQSSKLNRLIKVGQPQSKPEACLVYLCLMSTKPVRLIYVNNKAKQLS